MVPRHPDHRRRLRSAALIAPLALASVLAACSDDDEGTSDGTEVTTEVTTDVTTDLTTDTSATTTTEADTPSTTDGGSTTTDRGASTTTDGDATSSTDDDTSTTGDTGSEVADALSGEGADIFASLLDVVGIDELTDGEQVTLLAPSDDAFADIDPDQIVALIEDPEQVRDVLEAHVIEDVLRAEDLVDGASVSALSGAELPVTVAGSTVTIGGATVVSADIEFDGGVIHVIDEVLELPEG